MSNHVYPDEYIEYYAERYMALCLRYHGISLLQYLAAPEACERAALEHMPLLPAQRAVQARLDAEAARLEATVAHLPQRNGTVVEPLHHTRHPKRSLAANFARRVKV